MTTAIDSVVDGERMAEASEWFVRLRETQVSADTVAAWSLWCEEDPENARAYRQLQEIWWLAGESRIDEWPASEAVRGDRYTGDIPIREWLAREARRTRLKGLKAGAHRRGSIKQTARTWFSRMGMSRFGVAAVLALGICIWQAGLYLTRLPPFGVYSSERGEKRHLRLSDGSIMVLGGYSTVRVDYRDERLRTIQLIRGEAYFDVKRDRSRPFVVMTPNLKVTALGTAFSVRADDTSTVVSVTEGMVEIAREKAAKKAAQNVVRAKAGQQVAYTAVAEPPVWRSSDAATALSWQNGALTYVDEPLRSVVARVNRYSNIEVILEDSTLGDLLFTGTVFQNQIPEWAVSLERVFPVRAMEHPDGTLKLSRRR